MLKCACVFDRNGVRLEKTRQKSAMGKLVSAKLGHEKAHKNLLEGRTWRMRSLAHACRWIQESTLKFGGFCSTFSDFATPVGKLNHFWGASATIFAPPQILLLPSVLVSS